MAKIRKLNIKKLWIKFILKLCLFDKFCCASFDGLQQCEHKQIKSINWKDCNSKRRTVEWKSLNEKNSVTIMTMN